MCQPHHQNMHNVPAICCPACPAKPLLQPGTTACDPPTWIPLICLLTMLTCTLLRGRRFSSSSLAKPAAWAIKDAKGWALTNAANVMSTFRVSPDWQGRTDWLYPTHICRAAKAHRVKGYGFDNLAALQDCTWHANPAVMALE